MLRVGECVKVARIAKGMTLEQAGKLCGSQKGYMSGVENLKVAPPTPKILKKLCAALGLDYITMLSYRQVDPLKMPKDLSIEELKRVLGADPV